MVGEEYNFPAARKHQESDFQRNLHAVLTKNLFLNIIWVEFSENIHATWCII